MIGAYSLSEAFSKMLKDMRSSDELDKSVADFSKQIAELKAQAIDELNETDNGSTDLLNIETPLFQASTRLRSYFRLFQLKIMRW